jgi:hypothetical protein
MQMSKTDRLSLLNNSLRAAEIGSHKNDRLWPNGEGMNPWGKCTGGVGGGHGQGQRGGQVVPQGGGGGDAHEAIHQQHRRIGEGVQVCNARPAQQRCYMLTI